MALEITPRELEVIQLICNGWTSKEIAIKLNIRARTVDRHAEHARLKLRARNKVHLVIQAIDAGLVDIKHS